MSRPSLEQGPEGEKGEPHEVRGGPPGSPIRIVLVCDCSHTCREPGMEPRCSANASSLFPGLWNEPHARVPSLRREAQASSGQA